MNICRIFCAQSLDRDLIYALCYKHRLGQTSSQLMMVQNHESISRHTTWFECTNLQILTTVHLSRMPRLHLLISNTICMWYVHDPNYLPSPLTNASPLCLM